MNHKRKLLVASLYEYILKTSWTLPIDPNSGIQDQKIISDVVKKDILLGYSLPLL